MSLNREVDINSLINQDGSLNQDGIDYLKKCMEETHEAFKAMKDSLNVGPYPHYQISQNESDILHDSLINSVEIVYEGRLLQ